MDETAGTAGTGRRRSAPRGAAARVVVPDVRAWVRSTPGTRIWLLVLAATSCVMAAAPPDLGSFLLHQNSTNLAELGSRPVRALLGSALWTESPAAFGLYALCFGAVHAPAERRLGTRRWLGVAALAHAGASVLKPAGRPAGHPRPPAAGLTRPGPSTSASATGSPGSSAYSPTVCDRPGGCPACSPPRASSRIPW